MATHICWRGVRHFRSGDTEADPIDWFLGTVIEHDGRDADGNWINAAKFPLLNAQGELRPAVRTILDWGVQWVFNQYGKVVTWECPVYLPSGAGPYIRINTTGLNVHNHHRIHKLMNRLIERVANRAYELDVDGEADE